MKYLNTYKLFESITTGDVKLDCEEILLELKDVGFEIKVVVNSYENFNPDDTNINWINILIWNGKKFYVKDIEEYIERLKDYLGKFNLKKDQYMEPKIKHHRNPFDFQVYEYWELDIFFGKNI